MSIERLRLHALPVATVLVALNHLWQLGLSRERLQELGLTLGADVPVFVEQVLKLRARRLAAVRGGAA